MGDPGLVEAIHLLAEVLHSTVIHVTHDRSEGGRLRDGSCTFVTTIVRCSRFPISTRL